MAAATRKRASFFISLPLYWKFFDVVLTHAHLRLDISKAQAFIGFCGCPWYWPLLWDGVSYGQRPHERLGCMVRDMSGHVMVFLVDMAIQHRHIRMRHQRVDHRSSVLRCPIRIRRKIKQRAMWQYDDPCVFVL